MSTFKRTKGMKASERDKQVEAIVREQPGITSTELSVKWGCSLQYANSYLIRGKDLGLLRRSREPTGNGKVKAFGYFINENFNPLLADINLDEALILKLLVEQSESTKEMHRPDSIPQKSLNVRELYRASEYALKFSSINHYLNELHDLGYTERAPWGRVKYHWVTEEGQRVSQLFKDWQEAN